MIDEVTLLKKKSLLWKEYFENGCLKKFPSLYDFEAKSNEVCNI